MAAALLLPAAAWAQSATRCPLNGTAQQTTCPAGWECVLKHSSGGACHFEYPPPVPPHRENCWGCRARGSPACEPNLPEFVPSPGLPSVLVVGDSISHGYFPQLVALLNGTARLQHAPSNTGNALAGVGCFNISVLGGGTARRVAWDLVSFNFGLHDTFVPTPPPLRLGESLARYMELLRRYTERVAGSGAKGLFALTTPFMQKDVYKVIEVMNSNATAYMRSVGVPTADLWRPVVDYCGAPPYQYCDICQGSTPGHAVDCTTTPHYTEAGYRLIAEVLAASIRARLGA